MSRPCVRCPRRFEFRTNRSRCIWFEILNFCYFFVHIFRAFSSTSFLYFHRSIAKHVYGTNTCGISSSFFEFPGRRWKTTFVKLWKTVIRSSAFHTNRISPRITLITMTKHFFFFKTYLMTVAILLRCL